MKKYCKWKDEEVLKLFNHIESCTKKGQCLTKAFKSYAQISGRKPNSVRNYYYAELLNLEQDEKRRKTFGIDISKHQKVMPKFFSKEEIESQIFEIVRLYNEGYSIRKACLKLANGNIDEMVRLQNKYRTLLKKQPQLIASFEQKLKNEGKELKTVLPENVISMPNRKTKLSDSEINSLFLGLVKLIKNHAKQEVAGTLQKQNQLANQELRKMMVSISEKEHEIQKLRNSFELLKNENKKFEKKIHELRSENAKLIQGKSSKKLNSFRQFAKKSETKKTVQ